MRQAVQLREQDFGNFQDSDMAMNMRERQRFGRFYYRFPNGESGADVYDRLTIFEDHVSMLALRLHAVQGCAFAACMCSVLVAVI